MVNKLLSISQNTFLETVRQPIFTIVLSIVILLFILSPSISMYSMDEDVKLLRELGLSTLFLAGLFIAVFSATSGISEEIESKTVTTVLSKPLSRPLFIFGKYVGIALAVTAAHFIMSIAYIMMVRHGVLSTATMTHDWLVITLAVVSILAVVVLAAFFNYIFDWNFCASAVFLGLIFAILDITILSFIDKEWTFNPANNNISLFDINASILLLMAILLLASIAVLFAVRLNLIMTLSACIGVFLLGLVSDYVFGKYADEHIWAKIGRILVPNFQLFWVTDAIHTEVSVPFSYLFLPGCYTVLYVSAVLLGAMALFQRRQLG